MAEPLSDPLRHHGDVEAVRGLVDLAVNVYPGSPPPWLTHALHASLDDVGTYPCAAGARAAVASHHGRRPEEVLVTAGAAEAFTLLARLRRWRRPVVVHPQFTEPHAALEQAGHTVTPVILPAPYELTGALAAQVPDDADLVVIGNPTNPTGALHPAETLLGLLRPGRLVVVDEAFIDCVGEHASLAGAPVGGAVDGAVGGAVDGVVDGGPEEGGGLVVIRSLTKHWGMPGVRAGYLLGPPGVVAALARAQVPWSVGTTPAAAVIACCSPQATDESARRAAELAAWREHLLAGLRELADLGVTVWPSAASFVLARVGDGVHGRLREAGYAVRRADTFPGLDASFVRIATRPPAVVDGFLRDLRGVL